jgi:hypothetical protein
MLQQQQQAAHYEMDPRASNFQQFDYTLIQPQSFVNNLCIFLLFNQQSLFSDMKVNPSFLLLILKHQVQHNKMLN